MMKTQSMLNRGPNHFWCQYPPPLLIGGGRFVYDRKDADNLFMSLPLLRKLLPGPLDPLLPANSLFLKGEMTLVRRKQHSESEGTQWFSSGEINLMLSILTCDGRYEDATFILSVYFGSVLKKGFAAHASYKALLQLEKDNASMDEKELEALVQKILGTGSKQIKRTQQVQQDFVVHEIIERNPGLLSKQVLVFLKMRMETVDDNEINFMSPETEPSMAAATQVASQSNEIARASADDLTIIDPDTIVAEIRIDHTPTKDDVADIEIEDTPTKEDKSADEEPGYTIKKIEDPSKLGPIKLHIRTPTKKRKDGELLKRLHLDDVLFEDDNVVPQRKKGRLKSDDDDGDVDNDYIVLTEEAKQQRFLHSRQLRLGPSITNTMLQRLQMIQLSLSTKVSKRNSQNLLQRVLKSGTGQVKRITRND
ncbi:hypothetical protein MHU86_14904 [Fragilaria crotonensis]|nr:hypothetical protein MHU86_14904 [Fragilaria crotonensis]